MSPFSEVIKVPLNTKQKFIRPLIISFWHKFSVGQFKTNVSYLLEVRGNPLPNSHLQRCNWFQMFVHRQKYITNY